MKIRLRHEHVHARADRFLVLGVMLLSLFGILMVFDASGALALRNFSDQYYFVKEQLKWFVVGFGSLLFFSRLDYRKLYGASLPLLVVTLIFLLIVFIPGIGVNALGAKRWINLGFVNFQPAELAKLSLVLYLAAWFSYPEKNRLSAFLLLMGMILGLVILEPDLGTSIILLCIALLMYFFSGAPLSHFLALIPIFLVCGGALAVMSPYRFRRLTTFLNPESDPLGASYQIRQVLLSLGSGGVFGLGLGKSRQKYQYLPEANTDSIFAIIGEEVGFVGASVVILLFLFVVWRGFRIAKRTPDAFGRMVAFGISCWIGIQAGINISAMVRLIPLTGVPLPFISYGGSSLVVMLTAVGILLNISKRR